LAAVLALVPALSRAAAPPGSVPRFDFPKSGLELTRHTESGKFFDVVGRRSAVFGYENRALEAWVYPLKLVDDFKLSFQLAGYPLEIEGAQIATGISVRPESTTFTYSHAGFTVRQTIFAPMDEPGLVMLLDVQSVLPLTVIGSFRPRLKLMWPAGLMTNNVGWDEKEQVYSLTEESKRFAAVIGTPGARDVSLMPYQEEPRDVPVRFVVDVGPDAARTHLHSPAPLLRMLNRTLGEDTTFADLPVRFQCCAASIERAAEHWFTDGPLVPAVLASSAVPGLLPPVTLDGEHFIDGGVVNSIPVGRAVEQGARTIYVLQVGRVDRPLRPPKRHLDVAQVTFEIARRHRFAREMADLPDGVTAHVLPTGGGSPRDDSPLAYRNLSAASTRIERAYRASAAYLDDL